jgi:D-sedoheptulose 7-phosphate isomerase
MNSESDPDPTDFSPHARPPLAAWAGHHLARQREICGQLPLAELEAFVGLLCAAHRSDAQVFVFGNGGSAANASHFATDLGKGASDALGRPFRVHCLNEGTALMTAIGNDYAYEDIFLRPLRNLARPGDVAIGLSVSGGSPNVVRALTWARDHGLHTVAFVSARRGPMAEAAALVLEVPDTHYARVEDAHMTLCHLAAYALIEKVVTPEAEP